MVALYVLQYAQSVGPTLSLFLGAHASMGGQPEVVAQAAKRLAGLEPPLATL